MKNLNLKYTNGRSIWIYLLFSGLVFSFSSCDSFLDREPLDQISQASFWQKASDLNA
jgi:hypothetical protein